MTYKEFIDARKANLKDLIHKESAYLASDHARLHTRLAGQARRRIEWAEGIIVKCDNGGFTAEYETIYRDRKLVNRKEDVSLS
jgi:hypothetical protein